MLSFKVTDQENTPLSEAMIKLSSSSGDPEESILTDVNGVVKTAKEYPIGTKFNIMVSKEGYDLVTDVTLEITVSERASENMFSFQMKFKSVTI